MSILNVVKWACGAVVVCLGMNVSGMNKNNNTNGRTDEVRDSVISGNQDEDINLPEPRLAGFFYERCGQSFLNWKEDLSKFASEDFHGKLSSSDESVRKQASDELDGWADATCMSAVFASTWGHDINNRREALELLQRAKAEVKPRRDQRISSILEIIIGNCYIDPKICDGE